MAKVMRNKILIVLLGAALLAVPVAQATSHLCNVACRAVIVDWSWSGKYGGSVPLAVADYLSELGGGRFGSTINMRSYVAAECRMHPQETVGRAVERLLHTPTSKLPHIPIGGA